MKGNDTTPPIVCDKMYRLSYDGLYDITMCLCLLRILFGVAARGCAQIARHIYQLYVYNMYVPYNGALSVCTPILRVELAQFSLAFHI